MTGLDRWQERAEADDPIAGARRAAEGGRAVLSSPLTLWAYLAEMVKLYDAQAGVVDRQARQLAAVEKLCDEAEAIDIDAPWCPDEPPAVTAQRNMARASGRSTPFYGVTTSGVRAALAGGETNNDH